MQQTKFALNMISIVGLGLTKCSILVLYKNIFDVRKFRVAVYCVLAYVIGWTVSFTFSHLFTYVELMVLVFNRRLLLIPIRCYPITVFIEPYYNNNCVQTVPMFLALLVSIVQLKPFGVQLFVHTRDML